jgi:pilus assembly protein CpaE
VIVVANRTPSGGAQEVSRKDFEQSIERKVDIVLPLDPKCATQAAKLGQPLAKVAGNSKIGQPLAQLMNMAVSTVDSAPEIAAASASGSLFDKLGGFKTLMAKKPKEKKAA